MDRYVYPAVFRPAGDGYSVDFPDLPGCVSAGSNRFEALDMAREALSLHIYGMREDGDSLPEASNPATIAAAPGEFVSLVEARPDLIRDEIEHRSVKKTLTIPKWLNDEGERRRVNFSQVLQEALRRKIGI
jgi:predicted RNase H-like HicB family nuclease